MGTSPSMLDLLLEAHIDLDRQGPGASEETERALGFLEPWDRFAHIADLGCGTGGQTLVLARHLPGEITGLDMFPAFIDRFNERMGAQGLGQRVSGVVGSMEDLPFEEGSLDLIWSEGAIDNIGFEIGLSYWRRFLKPGGYVAVTSPSWLTEDRPEAVARFWEDAGSRLSSIGESVEALQRCGYRFVAAFALPERCWTERYFEPRAAAIDRLLETYAGDETALAYARQNRYESDLYARYRDRYGYVFYIGRAV